MFVKTDRARAREIQPFLHKMRAPGRCRGRLPGRNLRGWFDPEARAALGFAKGMSGHMRAGLEPEVSDLIKV